MIWKIKFIFFSKIKFIFFAYLAKGYFKSVGRNTHFFGKQRFGTANDNITIGKNCMIGHDVFFSCSKFGEIIIGDNCSVNTGCHIVAISKISIGNGTRIGEYVSIRDQNHKFLNKEIPIFKQGFLSDSIIIEEDCWIGRGVYIAPGITIGKGSVVGANSVVTKSCKPFSIIAGIPTKLIKKR